MELSTLWFILVTVLFTGFFILEGFDFGVGILLPFIGKTEPERRAVVRSIGPHWDGNEVWLLTAGGAVFAAFPKWYATMFSSLYLPLLLILVGLILRGLAVEYRNKMESPLWRSRWDKAIFVGSLLVALLFGVGITDLIHGLPFDGAGTFQGNFLDLVQPFPLLGGLASLSVFTWIGALFLQLKLQGELLARTQVIASKLGWGVFCVFLAMGIFGFTANKLLAESMLVFKVTAGVAVLSLLLSVLLFKKRPGIAFAMAATAIAMTTVTFFGSLFPNTMVSTLHVDWNLTTANASSTPYTLKVMSIVAAIFVPIVLVYQGYTYWIFRKRISVDENSGY
jgi:cytochrome d ubiquinol oxidase subunit II